MTNIAPKQTDTHVQTLVLIPSKSMAAIATGREQRVSCQSTGADPGRLAMAAAAAAVVVVVVVCCL